MEEGPRGTAEVVVINVGHHSMVSSGTSKGPSLAGPAFVLTASETLSGQILVALLL